MRGFAELLLGMAILYVSGSAFAADGREAERGSQRPEGAIVQAAELKQAQLKQAQIDTNQDGLPDRFEYYDDKDALVKLEVDSDFDGKVDEWQDRKDGKLSRALKDRSGEGRSDKLAMY